MLEKIKTVLFIIFMVAIVTIFIIDLKETRSEYNQNIETIKELKNAKEELKAVKTKLNKYYKELEEVEHSEEAIEEIPDGYVPLNECVPLKDICGYYYDKYDYLCFEVGDMSNQLDNPENWTYQNIIRKFNIPHLTDLEAGHEVEK